MLRHVSSALIVLALLPPTAPALAQKAPNDAINPAAKSIALSAKLPAYDVVSIHQNKTGNGDYSLDTTDDGIAIENAPLRDIVQFAYNLGTTDLISGISGPVDSARFDIHAKIVAGIGSQPTKFTDEQLQAMTIPLLADRLHLRVRLVPKMMAVYEIVVAKGGPKFKLVEPATDQGSSNVSWVDDDNILTAKKTTMSGLADVLTESPLHTIVVDRTGLKGEGDCSLKWTSDSALENGSPNAISIFTAIQDQLGLKLLPTRLPVDTLVIDHAEMPTEN